MKNIKALFWIAFFVIPIVSIAQNPRFSLDSLNSYGDEINPLMLGDKVYFTRSFYNDNRGGMQDPGDIWVSNFQDGTWETPVPANGEVNNLYFNGIFGLLGEDYYLFEHYLPGKQAPKSQGFSSSKLSGNSFQFPRKVDIKYFLNKSDHVSASISGDGTVLVMALDSYGSYGGEDIYVSFKERDGSWGIPKNLGSGINTKFQEMTPFLMNDNKTLFFSSNGWGGFGGRDVFVVQRLDDSWLNWSEPRNLGNRINTEGVELYFRYYEEDEYGIFTSTQNSEGYSDIRSAPYSLSELNALLESPIEKEELVVAVVPEPEPEPGFDTESEIAEDVLELFGVVRNIKDNSSVKARLEFLSTSDTVNIESTLEGFRASLSTGEVYEITVEAEGFVSYTEVFDIRTSNTNRFRHDITLSPIEVGTTVKLNNVLFKRGTTELLESSFHELDLVAEMMIENDKLEIFLSGHTDNRGNSFANIKLSQERVETVIDYLEGKGVSKKRLDGEGYGGSKPIASNANEETRRLNRRVEFTITKN